MRVLKIVAKLHLGVEANKLELKSNQTPRFNRNPGSSKILINQRLIRFFDKRVIFRVITPKVT